MQLVGSLRLWREWPQCWTVQLKLNRPTQEKKSDLKVPLNPTLHHNNNSVSFNSSVYIKAPTVDSTVCLLLWRRGQTGRCCLDLSCPPKSRQVTCHEHQPPLPPNHHHLLLLVLHPFALTQAPEKNKLCKISTVRKLISFILMFLNVFIVIHLSIYLV